MEVRHLRLVKSIVEQGSMAKSKDILCLTQSALSHQLKEAESLAGTDLFIRSNKKLLLTPAGDKVYKTAIEVLDKLDKLDVELNEISKGEKGLIRICTACFTNYYWLPGIVKTFTEQHPQVEIKIFPEFVNDALSRLQNHELDAVITNKSDGCKNINFYEIMTDELVAIVPSTHEWTRKKYVTAADFIDKNLIIFSKPMDTVVVYKKVLQPNGVEPTRVFEVPMPESMVEMVVAGLGVAVIPLWIAKPFINSGKIAGVRVTQKGLLRNLGMAVLERDSYPAYYKTMIDFFRNNLLESL